MAKKRAKVDSSLFDAAPSNLFSSTQSENIKRQTPAKKTKKNLARASYDMQPGIKNAVAERARRLGVPASQLAMFLLSDALRKFDAGEIDPTPYLEESTSSRFRYNIDAADWYYDGE